MIFLTRIALRLVTRVGLRWMVVAALGRFVLRRVGRGAVDRATADLEARAQQRLPAPAARAVAALPPGVLTAGGSAVVATRTARGAMSGGRRARRATRAGRARVGAGVLSAQDGWRRVQNEMRDETEASARILRARFLRATVGSTAATDSLLDRFTPTDDDERATPRRFGAPAASGVVEALNAGGHEDPHRHVAPPVSPGRRRAQLGTEERPARPGRSYRPPTKPWDRNLS